MVRLTSRSRATVLAAGLADISNRDAIHGLKEAR